MRVYFRDKAHLVLRGLMVIMLGICMVGQSHSQSTTISTQPTFSANNGSGLTTFNFHNSNPYPIKITQVATVLNATGTAEATLWVKPTPVNGPPGVISSANGWDPVAVGPVTSTIGSGSNNTAEVVLSNISVIIPANTTVGMAVGVFSGTSGRMRYTDITAGTNPTFSGGGVNIITGDLVSYGGTSPTTAPPNHLRGFTGSITFEQHAGFGLNNASISGLVSPVDFCEGLNNISVEVANMGTNMLNSVDVHWSINGVSQPVVSYNLPIDTLGSVAGHTAVVNLGSHVFTPGVTVLKVYTANPNGGVDSYNDNDTLVVNLAPALGGTYTINSGAPTAGTNYASFTDFINDLTNLGVCGPVVANVSPTSGPYNEVLNFGNIPNASAVNTIHINGRGRTVQYSNTITTANNDRQMLVLNGTKYLTIDSLNFKTLGTVGWAAHITNGSLYDTITNCIFDLTSITTTASGSSSGICFTGSSTSATTTGSNSKHCYIANNKLLGPAGSGGPYYAVSLAGADSNTVENNEIADFYMYGVYITGSSGCKILNNDIHRSNKTSVTTFYGIITLNGSMPNTVISGNRIHTPGGLASSTSSVYPIDLSGDGDASNPVLVSNNLVYDINQGGIIYGIQLNGALNNKVYHNSVTIDRVLTGSSVNRGIYALGTNTGSEVKNNIVSITAGTEGVKTGLFYNVTASMDAGASQRNVVYVNSSQPGGQFYAAYPSANTHTSMGSFQLANPGLEIGSLDIDPLFTNAATGNLMPMAALLAANGVDLTAYVPVDILGITRSTSPTPGAYEIPLVQGADGALTSLVSPVGSFCEGAQEVSVAVSNYGTLQLTNFELNWELNGVAQPPVIFSGILDTLNGAGQTSDTISIGIPNLAPGSSTVKVWLNINNDLNSQNDTLVVTIEPTVFDISALSATVCEGKEATLYLNPNVGFSPSIVSWENSSDGVNFTPIPNSNVTTYTSPSLTANVFYRAFINSGVNGCYTNEVEIDVVTAGVVSTQGGSRCGPGSVDLSGVGSPGSTLRWYSTPTGGAILGEGVNFSTPSISTTTNFYAAAAVPGGIESVDSPPNPGTVYINSSIGWGLHFTVYDQITIYTVDTYPSGTGSTATIQIRITDINDVVLYLGPVHTFTPSSTQTLEVVPVNVTLPPGTYKMGLVHSGLNNLLRLSSGATFPYTSPSNSVAITAGANGSGTAQTTAAYYWFYNWQISANCESARVPVQAVVNDAPSGQVFPGGQTYFCEDDSVALAVVPQPGDTYQWYFNDNPIANSNNFEYMASQTGNYKVEVTNTNNCTTVSAPVTATEVIPVATITPAGATTFCVGGDVNLQANTEAAYAYQWMVDGAPAGGSSSNYTASVSGSYTVVTTLNGCDAESSPVVVTVNPLPPANVTPESVYICDGESANLVANTGAGYTYQWLESGLPIAGATGGTYSATSTGSYSVWVTDANSCSTLSDDAIVTVYPILAPAIIQNGLVLSTSIYSSYQWNLNGAPIAGANSQYYTVTQSGDYSVTVTGANGCSGTSNEISLTNVNISEQDFVNISVFPNPASDIVQIVAPYAVNVELTAINGQVVLQKTATNMIDISTLADDVYLLRIKDADGKLIGIRKIVKISK